MADWDFEKNFNLNVDAITQGSPKKVWWRCHVCNHNWQARINSRLHTGCAKCKGLGVLKEENILWSRQDIRVYFDAENNPDINPGRISKSSKQTINLRCEKCGFKWNQVAYKKVSCRECQKNEIRKSQSLGAVSPEIAKDWNYDKNFPTKPDEVFYKQKKKAWWICSNGHQYEALISNRTTKNTGCNICLGRSFEKGNSFFENYPDLIKEWDFQKNEIDPRKIPPRSNKRVYWVCAKNHSWERMIHHRTKNDQGCPICNHLQASVDNNIEITHPHLVREWDFKKNIISITSLTFKSCKKVWWICSSGHEWNATVNTRASGAKCPYCIGKLASEDSNLSSEYPFISKEWHPTKNLSLLPSHFRPKSSKKVWWICIKGHEYFSSISGRASGSGCPICNTNTSKAEIRTYVELKSLLPDALWQEKINKIEIDVFVPSIKLGFEVDGFFWHKDKVAKDTDKNINLERLGIKIVRIRDIGLPSIGGLEFFVDTGNLTEKTWFDFLDYLRPLLIERGIAHRFDVYLKNRKFMGGDLYNEIVKRLPAPPKEKSIEHKFPSISKEWDYEKNHPLTPDLFTANSNENIWWKCAGNHSWQTKISIRTKGSNCPYCSSRQAILTAENSLGRLFPGLAKEYNTERNNYIDPEKVLSGTHKKVWWKCSNKHEWEATVASRTRSGRNCPFCAGNRVNAENAFETNYPELLREWILDRNDRLPGDVSKKSDYKAWWRCATCNHEWQAKINSRANGSGCIKCSYKTRFKK